MAKDIKAREKARLSIIAIANLVAAIVDTMRDMDMPNDIIHALLDKFDSLNEATVWGAPGDLLAEIVEIVRSTVPGND